MEGNWDVPVERGNLQGGSTPSDEEVRLNAASES